MNAARLSLVIPVLDESGSIAGLLEQLLQQDLRHWQLDILVVDDGCDGTDRIVQDYARRDARVRLWHRRGTDGLANAVWQGWQQCEGDVLGVMDGDGQHPAEALPALLAAIDAGAGLAIGSRFTAGGSVEGWPAWRLLASRLAHRVGRHYLPSVFGRISDPLSGMFLLQRQHLPSTSLPLQGYKILLAILAGGYRGTAREIPIRFRPRLGGRSKMGIRVVLAYLAQLRQQQAK